MKYLVTASSGPGFSSTGEAAKVIKSLVVPLFDEIARLEKEKKIVAGGLPVGERALIFVADAKSHDELDLMLRAIPGWGIFEWEVTPLQTFDARARIERDAVAAMKK